jgi:hypothetical protein
MSRELASVLGEAACDRQFTLIGDMSHKESAILKAVAQKDNIEALKAAGVRHLFLELPQEFQRGMDRFLTGKVSEADMLDHMEKRRPRAFEADISEREMNAQVLKLAKLAHEAGIKVHCADHRQQERRSKYIPQYEFHASRHEPNMTYNEFMLKFHSSTLPDGSKVTPDTDDRPLAKFIAERAGKDKAAIFYGAGHGRSSYGLDEILGEDRTRRVDVHASKPGIVSRLFERLAGSAADFSLDKDKPFADYYADTKGVERYPEKPADQQIKGDISLRNLAESRQQLDGGTAPAATTPPAGAKPARPARP